MNVKLGGDKLVCHSFLISSSDGYGYDVTFLSRTKFHHNHHHKVISMGKAKAEHLNIPSVSDFGFA